MQTPRVESGEWYDVGRWSAHDRQDAVAELVDAGASAVYEIHDGCGRVSLTSDLDLCDYFPDDFDAAGNLIDPEDASGEANAVVELQDGQSVVVGGGAAPAFVWARIDRRSIDPIIRARRDAAIDALNALELEDFAEVLSAAADEAGESGAALDAARSARPGSSPWHNVSRVLDVAASEFLKIAP